MIYHADDRITLHLGDSIEVLHTLPANSVHAVVTSPPYFALRSYLTKDDPLKVHEIGSEPTPEAFIQTMVDVFREVRRVLRDDGTLWMNLGDSYGGSGKGDGAEGSKQRTNRGSLIRPSGGVRRGPAAKRMKRSKNGMPNLSDLRSHLSEANIVSTARTPTLTIASKGVDVKVDDHFAPDQELTTLFCVQRVFIKKGNNDFRKVFDAVAPILTLRLDGAFSGDLVKVTDADVFIDATQGASIILSDSQLDSKPMLDLLLPPGSHSLHDNQTSLAVEESGKPMAERIGNGKPTRNSLPVKSSSKCVMQVDPVQVDISFANSFPFLACDCGDVSVSETSNEHFSFASVDGLIQIRFESVRHILLSFDDETIPYQIWYSKSIRTASQNRPGQLMNIPHRVAEALQSDGWLLRQTIVWSKRSPMPESLGGTRWVRCRVKAADRRHDGIGHYGGEFRNGISGDTWANENRVKYIDCPGCPKCTPHGGYILRRGQGRCTTAHEYVFLFAKTNRYFWDAHASLEKAICGTPGNKTHKGATAYLAGDDKHRTKLGLANIGANESRNMRSVWTLSSEPTRELHFATFPSELVRRCLSGSVSAKGVCPHCGAPWAPIIHASGGTLGAGWHDQSDDLRVGQRCSWPSGETSIGRAGEQPYAKKLHGYRPTCGCPVHEPIGATILDPFSGLATTGQTARHLGHRYIGIDLNEAYVKIAAKRIFEPPRWWLRQQKPKAKVKRPENERMLFT